MKRTLHIIGSGILATSLMLGILQVKDFSKDISSTQVASTQAESLATEDSQRAHIEAPHDEIGAESTLDTQTVPEVAQEAPVAVESTPPVEEPTPPPITVGTCDEWIAAAGIWDVGFAKELIRRESGCNPYAVNPSSGACGVAQELPCGKSGCTLGDGYCQVKWMNAYVMGRYGSWARAVAWHDYYNWY